MTKTVKIGAAINDSRINRIRDAQSLKEAQLMGILDRLKDWWRCGLKTKAIRFLFEAIFTVPAGEKKRIDEESLIRDFALLRCCARPDYAQGAQVDIWVSPETNEWSYTLRLEDKRGTVGLREGKALKVNDGLTLASFLDYQALLGLLESIRGQPESDPEKDYFPAILRLHDELMAMNGRCLSAHGSNALWGPEHLISKHKAIAERLAEVGLPPFEAGVSLDHKLATGGGFTSQHAHTG